MKASKYKLAIACILFTFMGINMNVIAGEVAVEWAPFIKASDVSDEQLIAKANVVNSDFLIKQKGFIKRELIKKDNNEYADVIYWEAKSDAVSAGEKVNSCVKCGDYFQLMKMGGKAGEGFSHYTIIRSWKR
jgi:hypothetical protein